MANIRRPPRQASQTAVLLALFVPSAHLGPRSYLSHKGGFMYQATRLCAGLVVTALLAGCTSDRRSVEGGSTAGDQKPSSNTVSVTADDYKFEAPATIPAGTTTIRLVNRGKELHQAQLMKLEEGKTLDDL